MRKKLLSVLATILVLLIAGMNAFAFQNSNGKLSGKIVDAGTGEGLIGASVAVEGTSLGAATDLDGNFIFQNLPAGTYTLNIRYIGYEEIDRQVNITGGETTRITIEMQPETVLGEEIIITTQAKGQMAAINQQRSSNTIKNVVSEDKLQEVPDVNAAESIGRLPGVSLKRSGGEGNQVVIRGLSPQYAIVQMDGVRLQGIGMDRGVGLSPISSDALGGVEVSKSLTPDQDADAIAGIVNLRTRVAQEGFHFSLLGQGGYNNLETSFGNYKIGANVSNRFFNNSFGVLGSINQERVIRSSDRFGAGYGRKTITGTGESDRDTLVLTNNASVRELKSIRHRTNGSLVLDYKSDYVVIKLSNFYSQMVNSNELRNNMFRFAQSDFRYTISDSKPIESIQSHSMENIFNVIGTKITLDLQYSRTHWKNKSDEYEFFDDQATNDVPINEEDRTFAHPSDLIDTFYDISSIDRAYLYQNFRSDREREDITKRINLEWEIPFNIAEIISGNVTVGGAYSLKNRFSERSDIYSYYHGGIGVENANRVLANNPDFLRAEDIPGYRAQVGIPAINFLDEGYDYGDILNGRYELGWSADLNKLQSVHDYYGVDENGDPLYPDSQTEVRGIESAVDDYENEEEYLAGFFMVEINIGKRIMLLPGLRYEKMRTTYSSNFVVENPFNPVGVESGYPIPVTVKDRVNENLFPSVNLKIDATDNIILRGAYYKSTARPNYLLLSPGIVTDIDRETVRAYNPYLDPSIAHNYDIGISFSAHKFGFFTFNLFYKEMTGLLYNIGDYFPKLFEFAENVPPALMDDFEEPRVLYDDDLFREEGRGSRIPSIPVNNPNKGTVRGLEVNWQTNFYYLPGMLRGLVLDINYSYMQSSTRYPFLDTDSETVWNPLPTTVYTINYNTRPGDMIDTPTSLFNARMGWDYRGFSTRISFRNQWATLTGPNPRYPIMDGYSLDNFRIDVQLKQDITENLSIAIDLANLTNEIDESQISPLGYEFPTNMEFYGFTSQFSVRYHF